MISEEHKKEIERELEDLDRLLRKKEVEEE